MDKKSLDPAKIEVGYMIVDKYPKPTYFGIVVDKTEKAYTVKWNHREFLNSYPFRMVIGLTDDRIIVDEKKQLAIMLTVQNLRN
jgi:hypothetical protein